MLRVVLDTSSLVSYVLTRGDIMWRVIAHWRANRYILLSSPQTLPNRQPYWADCRSGAWRRRRLMTCPGGSSAIPGTYLARWDLSGACHDPKDDKFLACAVEGEAQYLVSSEFDPLHMRSFRGVVIHNPGQLAG